MDAILEVQTPAGSFRNYWLHCPNLYPSDLQTGDVVPCDPIASSFEEKDGFLVSGSPILLPTGADIFVNLKTPSRAYRRNMKDYRMEIVHWLDEIMITRFLLTREEDWLYVELDYACVHGRTSKQGRVCTTIYIRSLGPCRNIDTANL
jgi:hypothetical protein